MSLTLSPQLVAELFPAPGEWTEATYLALPDNNRLVELVDGNLEMIVMPTDAHQRIVGKLHFWLLTFLLKHPLGTLRLAPLRVRLWAGHFREPDLVFMPIAHADRIGNEYWGIPSLVIEVHSPGTLILDQRIKKEEYAQAGIAEYWMVDGTAQTVEVYVLRGAAYELLGRFAPGMRLASEQLPNLALDVSDIFAAD